MTKISDISFLKGTRLFWMIFLLLTGSTQHLKAQYPLYFEENFDREPFSKRLVYEVADPSRVRLDTTQSRLGDGCVEVSIHGEDLVARGNRSEISISNFDPLNTTVWYAWSFMIPEDFIDEIPDKPIMISQFHMLPDFEKGERWGTYDAEPMLSVTYRYEGEVSYIRINYGLKNYNLNTVAELPIEKGVWIDLMFHLKWSRDQTGFVEAFMNGKAVSPFNGIDYKVHGPNMYNDVPPYLKFGIYRDKELHTVVNKIYFDELRIGTTLREVSINPLESFGSNLFRRSNLEEYQTTDDLKAPDDYILGPDDELNIAIWGYSDFTGRFVINKDGYITPRLVGRIYLKGLSFAQAKALIRQKFAGVYDLNNSEIDVTLTFAKTINVNIMGEVHHPGSYEIPAISNVFNALAAVGGPNHIGSVRNIYLRRSGKTIRILDVYDYLLDPGSRDNLLVQDRDVIFVPVAGRHVKIRNEVKRPNNYEIKEEENLKALIDYAGGFTAGAYKSLIKIKRYTVDDESVIDLSPDSILQKGKDFELVDGDIVYINSIPEGITNYVEVSGAIQIPGKYELKKGYRVSDLLTLGGGFSFDAYLNRGYIMRLQPDLSWLYIPINPQMIMDQRSSAEDLPLQPLDKVTILSSTQFRDRDTVFVYGAVRQPGWYIYGENMTLSDLLYLSKGLKREAANNRVEVARIINFDEAVSQAKPTRTTVLKTRINYDLKLEKSAEEFVLQPFDQVFIRVNPAFEHQQNVVIRGEVNYPGSYALIHKNEKVTDLLQRSGDLTEWAFTEGATFIRRQDTIGFFSFDLDEVLEDPNSPMNFILKDGDIINIPTLTDYIEIQGAIGYPGRDRLNAPYKANKRAKHYIKHFASGFDKKAIRRKTYVQESNGLIKNTFSLRLINFYPKVSEGSTVVAVYKEEKAEEEETTVEKEPINWNDAIENASVKITGLLTLWILLTRIR